MEKDAFPSDQYAIKSQVKYHGYNPEDTIIELVPSSGLAFFGGRLYATLFSLSYLRVNCTIVGEQTGSHSLDRDILVGKEQINKLKIKINKMPELFAKNGEFIFHGITKFHDL